MLADTGDSHTKSTYCTNEAERKAKLNKYLDEVQHAINCRKYADSDVQVLNGYTTTYIDSFEAAILAILQNLTSVDGYATEISTGK